MRKLILKEDWPLFLLLAIFLVCLSSANSLLQICGDVLFISRLGVEKLPLMYIISALVLVMVAVAVIPVIDRLDRTRVYYGSAGLLALSLLLFRLLNRFTWVYYAIYITTYLLESILFLEFWLIAASITPPRQAKRIFPLLLGLSLGAGMATSFLSRPLAQSIHTENILLLCSFLCGLTLLVNNRLAGFSSAKKLTAALGRSRPIKDIGSFKRLQMDLKIVWNIKLARIISFCFVIYTVLNFILDYKFNQAASLYFTTGGKLDADRLTAFYGQIKGVMAMVSLPLQFFLSGRLINQLGVCLSYLFMPFVFFFGFFAVSLAQIFPKMTFPAAVSGRFGQKVMAGSLYRSSSELIYNAIPNEKRGRVRAFHAALMEPLGVALAGGIIILNKNYAAGLALGLSLLYIFLVTRGLKRNYIASLVQMLKEKSGGLWDSLSGTFGRYGTKEVLSHLTKALEDPDPQVRIFALEMLGELKERHRELYPLFEAALQESDASLRRIGLKALGESGRKEKLTLLRPFLDDSDYLVQAQAIISLWKLAGESEELAKRLSNLFQNEDREARRAAIEVAGSIPTAENLRYLKNVLNHDLWPLRREAVRALGRTEKKEAAEYLVELLGKRDNHLNFLISHTLAEMGEAGLKPVKEALADSGTNIYSRYFLLKALETNERAPWEEVDSQKLKEAISTDIRQSYYHLYLIMTLSSFNHKRATLLLEETLKEENKKARANVLTCLKIMDGYSQRMELVSRNIHHPDDFVRGQALEVLENITEPSIAIPLIGLLEEKELPEEMSSWRKKFGFPCLTATEAVAELLKAGHNWLRAVAIFSIGELKLSEFKEKITGLLRDSDSLIRANAQEALGKMG